MSDEKLLSSGSMAEIRMALGPDLSAEIAASDVEASVLATNVAMRVVSGQSYEHVALEMGIRRPETVRALMLTRPVSAIAGAMLPLWRDQLKAYVTTAAMTALEELRRQTGDESLKPTQRAFAARTLLQAVQRIESTEAKKEVAKATIEAGQKSSGAPPLMLQIIQKNGEGPDKAIDELERSLRDYSG